METRVREGRTALAITVLLIVTLTVPTLVVGGGFGLAAAQQSPSPTGTAPTIELVNPSDYNDNQRPVISDKDNNFRNDSSNDDPNDDRYHFNAWTRNAPNNATVEFFIIQGSTQVGLGPATNRGGGVYDLYSAIPDALNDGDAVVRAVMFSGGELDRDEQNVTINEQDDASEAEMVIMQGEFGPGRAAETVELTYPQNSGGVGFFARPGGTPAAHIEMTHSRTGTAGDSIGNGGGPENLRVFYTTSFRGTDPDWKQCGEENQSDSENGVTCTLVDGDQPEAVTGIAAVTRDNEAAPDSPPVQRPAADNSGDAHVATGYRQIPTGVNIASPGGSTAPGCSPLIPVTVSDQIGRKIVGAPLDVHAQGPTDGLAFNTERDETGAANQPHDNDPPENHATEPGRQCSDGGPAEEFQGVHAEAGSLPDRKHIESTNHTDTNGQFVYQMFSNAPGGTTMTAFVDMDDNDRHCATEASGNGIITWGNGGPAAPLPPGPEDQSPCGSSASASGSTSPSGSASATSSSPSQSATSPSPSGSTASPTATASRSASPTVTPSQSSPTSTATGSTSPTGPGPTTASPQRSPVEVTLETSQPRKTFGKSFTLTGAVTSDNPACTDLVNVRILRDVVGGEDEFELWAQETTDGNGAFAVTDRADLSASYIAEVLETAACDDATSAPQPVLVRTKVSLTLSDNKLPEGGRVRFTIKTAPCPLTARDRVLLFRAIEGAFGKAGRDETNGRCVASITRRVNESSVFQARWPKQTAELLAGKSRSKAVRVTD